MEIHQILQEQEKKNAAAEAVKFIQNQQIIGLGTGSTAWYAIQGVAELVRKGMSLKAVATSAATAKLASSLGIELLALEKVTAIDLTIDGADEFNSSLQLIKGGGAALFREKIVASLSRKVIIIADSTKKVAQLGAFKVPVEIVPFAFNFVQQELQRLDATCLPRKHDGKLVMTDNQNYIIDADFGLIADPKAKASALNQIEGIAAHGLFIQLASQVIMGQGDQFIIYDGN